MQKPTIKQLPITSIDKLNVHISDHNVQRTCLIDLIELSLNNINIYLIKCKKKAMQEN